MCEHRTHRASDLVVMGCVLDLVMGVMGRIKRGHPERSRGFPDLIWESDKLIESPQQLFARNAIRWAGHNPNSI